MAFGISPGVYAREFDRAFSVAGNIGSVGAIVVTADKGFTTPTFITSERDLIRVFGEPSASNPSIYAAIRFLRQSNALFVARAVASDSEVSSGIIEIGAPGSEETVLTFSSSNQGVWGNGIGVELVYNEEEAGVVGYDVQVSFGGEVVEVFTVSLDSTKKDGFGQSQYIEDRINGRSAYITVDHDSTVVVTGSQLDTLSVTLTGGLDGVVAIGDAELISAVDQFSNAEDITVNYLINAGWISTAYQQKLAAICESRKDCVAILDTPRETGVNAITDLVDFRKNTSGINSTFVGYYAGWLKIYDVYTAREVFVPPSGDVAGVFAFSQVNDQPWSAPAGMQRGVIGEALEVSNRFSEADRDLLYRNQINPIQQFPGQGIIVWGQKTASAISASLDRFNVRFLFNYIRTSLQFALKPFVFQPNSQFTRDSIFALITGFMDDVAANDGVYEYKIVIDEINTPTVIDNNMLIIELYVKPVRTAEFIRLDVISVPTAQTL